MTPHALSRWLAVTADGGDAVAREHIGTAPILDDATEHRTAQTSLRSTSAAVLEIVTPTARDRRARRIRPTFSGSISVGADEPVRVARQLYGREEDARAGALSVVRRGAVVSISGEACHDTPSARCIHPR